MFDDFDLSDFWKQSDYATKNYVDAPLTNETVTSVERALGFKLPAAHVALMRSQNGGFPKRTCFPSSTRTSWAEDHIAIHAFNSIGHGKPGSIAGPYGSQFMQEEWGYPLWGVCICDCPSGGHDMVMLDYRSCGQTGEPRVVHVDQDYDFRVTVLAANFEMFVRGLVEDNQFKDLDGR